MNPATETSNQHLFAVVDLAYVAARHAKKMHRYMVRFQRNIFRF